MSGFKCGIVGLPNVGKSTLFSALSGVAAEAANYPFCTIEPNIAMVEVPDERLQTLNHLVTTEKVLPAVVQFVDIAGLVRGASKGEGRGNQFLEHIRSVDAIVQVIRCFDANDIVHVDGRVDPVEDLETIQIELALSDLEIADKLLRGIEKKIKSQDKEAVILKPILEKIVAHLGQGKPLFSMTEAQLNGEEKLLLKGYSFLTLKPQLFVANIGEDDLGGTDNDYVKRLKEVAAAQNTQVITICASIESEISQLDEEERRTYLDELGIKESGLTKLIQAGYHLLGLRTYFTVGPKEIRAWTFKEGSFAPQAAGKIHSDFEKGFIRAETFHYDDMMALKSEKAVREAGKMRMEGKDYVVKDGDIMHFHFND